MTLPKTLGLIVACFVIYHVVFHVLIPPRTRDPDIAATASADNDSSVQPMGAVPPGVTLDPDECISARPGNTHSNPARRLTEYLSAKGDTTLTTGQKCYWFYQWIVDTHAIVHKHERQLNPTAIPDSHGPPPPPDPW